MKLNKSLKKSEGRKPREKAQLPIRYSTFKHAGLRRFSTTTAQRKIILRLHDDGWTPEEISERTGMPVEAVRHTIADAIVRVA